LPTAKKTLEMKSNFFIPKLTCLFLNKNENEFIKMKELISRCVGSLVFFVRTLWYRLTHKIQISKLPINNYDYSGTQKIKIIKSEGYRMLFASKLKNTIFGTLGLAPTKSVDFQKALSLSRRKNHRFFVKKHVSWRLGLSF